MLRSILAGTFVLLFLAVPGWSEVPVTAQNDAVDSDVVLESAVREIKSAPRDMVNTVADGLKYIGDETRTAVNGAAAVFKKSPVEECKRNATKDVSRAWSTWNDIVFRSYDVSPAFGEKIETSADSLEQGLVNVSDLFPGVDFPEGTSAYYRPGFNKLFVRQTLKNILVMEDMLAEEHNVLRELRGHQVEIETKLIEVSQKTLDELGFNWTFDSKHGGGAKLFENLSLPANQDLFSDGLRTAATALAAGTDSDSLTVAKTAGSLRWNLVIRALEQADSSDVLSSPSIVTRDGNTAMIQVGEERMMPKRFSINSANTSVYVEHSDWDSELMGVVLEVTPELRQNDLIDLELNSKVLDLIGYDDYQVTPDNASMIPWQGRPMGWGTGGIGRFPIMTSLANGAQSSIGSLYSNILSSINYTDPAAASEDVNDPTGYTYNGYIRSSPSTAYYAQSRMLQHDTSGIKVPSLHGQLPYLRIREVETVLTVTDGGTIGLGGLIYNKLETYRDKVPVLGSIPLLGRLFRSEGERNVKRNLMVFVTASQVDVNGRKISDYALNSDSVASMAP